MERGLKLRQRTGVEDSKLIARKAIINAYIKQGYDVNKSAFLKEIEQGDHDDIFTVRAIEEALALVQKAV